MTFVVVTGLAASGKTTLARALAERLDLPLLSKDALSEALFDALGSRDLRWARTVSRAADEALLRIVADLDGAVLEAYWRAETVDRLAAGVHGPFVEVLCRCAPDVAAARFLSRTRHPGHADAEREIDREAFVAAAARFPFGTLGPVVEVDTEREADVDAAVARIREAVAL
jgi:predicted kinase